MKIETKASPVTNAIYKVSLANYNDQFVFWSGGTSDGRIIPEGYSGDVFMYDIQNDTWSACPKRCRLGGDHRSFCMNDKLYIFCSKTG